MQPKIILVKEDSDQLDANDDLENDSDHLDHNPNNDLIDDTHVGKRDPSINKENADSDEEDQLEPEQDAGAESEDSEASRPPTTGDKGKIDSDEEESQSSTGLANQQMLGLTSSQKTEDALSVSTLSDRIISSTATPQSRRNEIEMIVQSLPPMKPSEVDSASHAEIDDEMLPVTSVANTPDQYVASLRGDRRSSMNDSFIGSRSHGFSASQGHSAALPVMDEKGSNSTTSIKLQDPNAKASSFRRWGITFVTWFIVLASVAALVYSWSKGYVTEAADKVIYTLYAGGLILTSAAATKFFVDDVAWSVMESLQFRGVVMSNMIFQLTNCYSDFALLIGYVDSEEWEYVQVFIFAMIMYRIVSIIWVWFNFHSIPMCFLQLFEFLTVHEAYRSFSEKVLFVSMHQIGIFEIVLEDLPSIVLNLNSVGRGTFDIRSFAIAMALVTSLVAIVTRNVGFDTLQMQNNRFRESKLNYIIHNGFRIFESFARVATCTLMYMYSPWILAGLFVAESSFVFFVNIYFTDKSWSLALKYSLLWFANLPVLSSETFGWHLKTTERLKVHKDNQDAAGIHFQKLFDICAKLSESYREAINASYKNFNLEDPVTFNIEGEDISVDPPALKEIPEARDDGFYGWPFVIVLVIFRALSNLVIVGILALIPLNDVNKDMRLALILLSLGGSILMIPCVVQLFCRDCILPETGMMLVGAPFSKRMSWTELLEEQSNLLKSHAQGQRLHVNLISHIENFIVMGKNVMETNERGELITTLAARLGLDAVIKVCIRAGLDLNRADHCGYTPLFLAVAMRHIEVAQTLLEYRASCNPLEACQPPLVNPTLCISGGSKLPPILAAPYSLKKAKHFMNLLSNHGVRIDTDHPHGNILHSIFDMGTGRFSMTDDIRTEMLENVMNIADAQDCRQPLLDATMLEYTDAGCTYPPTVLDRIILNPPKMFLQYRTYIDFLLKNGATVGPSIASKLLEKDDFDTFKYIFGHEHFSADKTEILSKPWHGPSLRGSYVGPCEDDDEDFYVTLHSIITEKDDQKEEITVNARLRFSFQFDFDDGYPYSCYLVECEPDSELNISRLIWNDLCLKSLNKETLEGVPYEEVVEKIRNEGSTFEVETLMGKGFQRQLCAKMELGEASEDFVDFTKQILGESSEPSPFLRRINGITAGGDFKNEDPVAEAAALELDVVASTNDANQESNEESL